MDRSHDISLQKHDHISNVLGCTLPQQTGGSLLVLCLISVGSVPRFLGAACLAQVAISSSVAYHVESVSEAASGFSSVYSKS